MTKTLGVTGGIGSGKTAACRFFEELGARLFLADAVAKRLMREDEQLREAITEAFGPQSYSADGSLDRAYLADQVFSDEANVARINALVHPRVFEAFEAEKTQTSEDGVALLVHESAILFESGADAHVDAAALVDAPEAVRLRRAAERDGTTAEAIRARMNHQRPPAELRARADFVIDNSGSLGHLRAEVQRVFQALQASA